MSKISSSPRNKQPFVISELTRMARSYGPGMKLPTAQQLASKLGVTLTTLDRSLAKLEAKGVIHRRQGSGIYVSSHLLEKRVGLIFGRNIFQLGSSAFYLLLLQHCEKRAEAGNEQFSFYLSPRSQETEFETDTFNPELADSLKQGKLDGLLICELNNPQYEQWLANQNIPAVALAPSSYFPTVGIDTNYLIDECVGTLASRGCQTIGLLGILTRHCKMFTNAAEKHGLKVIEEAVLHPEDESEPPFDSHEPLGREWMRRCIERCGGKKHLPDALVITDDILARGACLHMKETNIRPGKDIQVASHANQGSLVLEYWQDNLILAEVNPADFVDLMFTQLESLMLGGKPPAAKLLIKPAIRT
ncbi:GntR family transcriptional regulator [Coraliomargarita parva]|uniref:GntR family transcriptional regulator n=1 Tax=Coraliomargarita parva TaxID=3014050 RepID=UPI0022B569D8|nr:GntR family transcriptional regulator [Coraliomargarita parva]